MRIHLAEIRLLEEINAVLKERHDYEQNYKSMSLKFAKKQKEERERQDEVSSVRKLKINQSSKGLVFAQNTAHNTDNTAHGKSINKQPSSYSKSPPYREIIRV